MAVQDAGAYGGSGRQAHGGLPCSTRHHIGLSLGLHIVSALVPYGQSHYETANPIIVTKHLLPYSDL
jgi:hypothetical protein